MILESTRTGHSDSVPDPFFFGKDFGTDGLETRASELLKTTCHLFCTVADGHGSTEPSIDNIYERGFCRPRMWAQYAENHSGVCLVFDRVRLDEAIRASFGNRAVFSGSVAYRNRPRAPEIGVPNAFILDYDAIRAHGLEKAIENHLACFYKELFFEKSKDWADEREYRWLVRTADIRDLYVSLKHSMVGVVVGDRCSVDQRNRIHESVAGIDISVGIMNWKSGIPEVLLSSPGIRWSCRAE
jgi:hypothetical protein